MAEKIIKTIFQLRRATTEEWNTYKNEVPAVGEPCFDITKNTLKIGNGVNTYDDLDAIGGISSISVDGRSIILDGDVLKLMGFEAAAVGAQPIKNAQNKIEWRVPSNSNLDELQLKVNNLEAKYTTIQESVNKLEQNVVVQSSDEIIIGDDGTLSVGEISITKIVQDANTSVILDCNT